MDSSFFGTITKLLFFGSTSKENYFRFRRSSRYYSGIWMVWTTFLLNKLKAQSNCIFGLHKQAPIWALPMKVWRSCWFSSLSSFIVFCVYDTWYCIMLSVEPVEVRHLSRVLVPTTWDVDKSHHQFLYSMSFLINRTILIFQA